METYQDIIMWIIIFFAAIGFSVSVAYLLHCFKEKDASDTDNILPTKMEYKSTSTPYKDLWNKASLSKDLDMDACDFIRTYCYEGTDQLESAYLDALIKLLKRGKHDLKTPNTSSGTDGLELRKYCAEYASEKLKNTRATIEDTLNVSNIMYNYIKNGIMPNKEKEDNHG